MHSGKFLGIDQGLGLNTFFFLLCTLGGADRVPQLRKIGYLFILENVAGTSTVRPFLVHPPVLPHPGKPT